MSYRMYRVFCATPGDSETGLEAERQAFHEVMGQVNGAEAMPEGILFVPVSILPNLTNKAVFQPAVDENVRACAFFVQVLDHTWGPATRNFEREFQLAMQSYADPALPMKGVSLFFKDPGGKQVEPGVAQLRKPGQGVPVFDFSSLDDFTIHLRSQLSAWLRSTS